VGHDVLLIARGAHYEALKSRGLRIDCAESSDTIEVPVAPDPGSAGLTEDDVVILGVKGQDTHTALHELRDAAPGPVPVVCLQNGVSNEPAALRLFPHVYGIWVMCPASHLEPGVVRAESSPIQGLFDIGRFPNGVDDRCEQIASALSEGPFESVPRPDIMRWKHRKLIMNLGNAVQALYRWDEAAKQIASAARAEGETVLAAAGIDVASEAEDKERRGDRLSVKPVAGVIRSGGSTWQSLARGTGAAEADHLNGEIVWLGRLHGVATPVNEMLQNEMRRAAAARIEPATLEAPDLAKLTPKTD
jgi:2-dehydropantoate 2-reductase